MHLQGALHAALPVRLRARRRRRRRQRRRRRRRRPRRGPLPVLPGVGAAAGRRVAGAVRGPRGRRPLRRRRPRLRALLRSRRRQPRLRQPPPLPPPGPRSGLLSEARIRPPLRRRPPPRGARHRGELGRRAPTRHPPLPARPVQPFHRQLPLVRRAHPQPLRVRRQCRLERASYCCTARLPRAVGERPPRRCRLAALCARARAWFRAHRLGFPRRLGCILGSVCQLLLLWDLCPKGPHHDIKA
eukprot:SM000074S21635  [mRNA]  locus=s74:40217:41283:+ [translate_table: standard]